MKTKFTTSSAVIALLAGSAVSASAAISVANTLAGSSATVSSFDATGLLFSTAPFDLNGGNVVALLVSSEGIGDSGVRQATFAGQVMNEVYVEDNGAGDQTAAIYYLIDPVATSGSFEMVLDPSYGQSVSYGVSAISLGNVLGYADENTNRSTSSANTADFPVSYTVATPGSFVLGVASNNDFNGERPLGVSSGNPDTPLLPFVTEGSSGHFHTSGSIDAPGTYTDNYFGQFQRNALATLAFEAIPEPSSVLLGGLGVFALLGRRLG
ncbi:PEP-CTERM sorting domain-containing protein [Roseibacillus ishigakijimensis]|uniref:PEP-CTERM sorting domain-containing protein n=1 Tax=Roseibacillus ishigakijimensis TaxID=454146 RepID=A0A934VNE6_9BACT|nr:PEP-CTERM sorting domain-containing protein [Roseibacillus ishigakijimensis]MBK1835217.1 PEP-CTERM sorting domain-containing protein [Roseibacillus ishigakijimensis]